METLPWYSLFIFGYCIIAMIYISVAVKKVGQNTFFAGFWFIVPLIVSLILAAGVAWYYGETSTAFAFLLLAIYKIFCHFAAVSNQKSQAEKKNENK